MPRARDPNRDKAKELYLESDGKMLLKDIAEQLGKSDSQIRKWKNQDKWDNHLKGNVTNQSKGNVTKQKKKNKTKQQATESVEVPLNENGELTDKQWLFCMYYIKYFNATKAYQKAYEADYATSMVNGSKLLRNTKIKPLIIELKQQRLENEVFDKYDVLQKYKDIAFADIGDYIEVNSSGYAAKVRDLENIDTSIITEISNTEEGIKLKLADKMKALDFLAKYTDLLNENEKKRLKEEKLKADIAKVHSETKGDAKTNIQTLDMSKLTTEELRAIANSKR